MNITKTLAEREIVISRTFNAPPEKLFDAWTVPKLFVQWWGPFPQDDPVAEMDVRPGGAFRWVVRSPQGTEYPMTGTYTEIVRPERLVYTLSVNEHPRSWLQQVNDLRHVPKESRVPDQLVSVTFVKARDKTRLTITTLFDSADTADAFREMGMEQGWSKSLDRLARVVSVL